MKIQLLFLPSHPILEKKGPGYALFHPINNFRGSNPKEHPPAAEKHPSRPVT